MLKRHLFATSALLLSLIVSAGCATAPDVPVCVEITPSRGWCTYTISDKDFEISETKKHEGKTYWELRPTMLLVPASSWAKIKAFIIKTCKQHGNCDQAVSSWDRKLNSIDTKVKGGR